MATITNEQLLKMIKKTGDLKEFEPEVKKVTRKSIRRLVETTAPSGSVKHVAKGWTDPKKIGVAMYMTVNAVMSYGGKWNIAKLLNDGTKRYTKSKGMMYIPFSNRAKNKRRGAKIPSGYKWGTDFILTKSRRGIKASHFIDKEEKKASKELEKEISKKIDRILK